MVATFAPPVYALPYDGTNPGATPCGNGSHPTKILDTEYFHNSGGTVIGRVELRHSPYCATVWSRVTNTSPGSLSVREKITLYSSPNHTGATTYTETDTLASGQSGWSKQYRDRPAFRARGEIFYGGVWQVRSTGISQMYAQFDGNHPTGTPVSCDETPSDYCHRWNTAGSNPTTLVYQKHSSLVNLPGDPFGDVDFIMEAYEDLGGLSPNWTASSSGWDIRFFTYNDPFDNSLSTAQPIATASAPRYWVTADVKFNLAHDFNLLRGLICHEVGHVHGLLHVTSNGVDGSKATCIGTNMETGPYIDDEQALTKIYSTPLAAS